MQKHRNQEKALSALKFSKNRFVMKKILRITESQLKRIVRKICEEGPTQITANPGNDGVVDQSDIKQSVNSAMRNGLKPENLEVVINGGSVKESVYTKKQLKEAKKQMMLSNSRRITKQQSRRR